MKNVCTNHHTKNSKNQGNINVNNHDQSRPSLRIDRVGERVATNNRT